VAAPRRQHAGELRQVRQHARRRRHHALLRLAGLQRVLHRRATASASIGASTVNIVSTNSR
jgi:hypothetical protein